ncbi:MAG: 23S rRNA (guanosine(2251)-2'-O)-methyltransferase RlmB, partial [Clostridia bacterium]
MQIEGKNPVKEALEGDAKISKLYVSKTAHDLQSFVYLARAKKITVCFVDREELDKMSETQKHQGLIATADEFEYCAVDDIVNKAKSCNQPLFMLILDGIEDPHNLGSIIRVAECCGAHGIVIPNHRAVSVNSTVVKVSAGAISHMLIAQVTNINDTIRQLKDNFVNVLCADMDGQCLFESHLDGDLALVIGSEGFGVKQLTRKLCDGAISIPQYGKINSLNASVATGV